MIRIPGPRADGDEYDILAWLLGERGFGLAAERAITQARQHPGWYAYTADGNSWVRARPDGGWEAGDSADAEMRLAGRRGQATLDRIDPDQVKAGDVVMYRHLSPVPELLTGEVEYATAEAVHVNRLGWVHAVAWTRIVSHQPKGDPR